MEWKTLLAEHLSSAKRPLIVVLGPTASGKTDFSLDLARNIDAEIINADSRQLYRGLDIGTAKIAQEDMRDIPHHLIDVLDPSQEVTIAWYQERATEIIEEILSRKKVPLLVGGSMLYISAIIDGLKLPNAVDPELRKKLEQEYEADGGRSMYAKLQKLDPETAAAFHRNNKPYVIRAMEILESTGIAASHQKKTQDIPYDLFLLGIRWPREKLVERIDARTQKLLQSTHILINWYPGGMGGWVEEVLGLLQRGIGTDAPAMKSHGYCEIMEELLKRRSPDGTWTTETIASVKSDPKLRERIAANTRRYAKRQMTWWSQDPRIHWIDGADIVREQSLSD